MLKRPSTRRVTITHAPGLHARPSLLIVKTVQKYRAKVYISNGREQADARDILHLMSLGAPCGTELTLTADGDDAEEVLDVLEKLFADKFGFGDE
jgi:phosphocarrier protein NPr